MSIVMTGLEHSEAPIALREKLSFTKQQTIETVQKIKSFPGVLGCVLISTCNRTELYVSCSENQEPGMLLCRAAGSDYTPYRHAFITRADEQAVRHLMEVAAGLRSRIWGEDQIISQVKDAIGLARQAKAADAVMEALFRAAVAAGKEVRTKVHLNEVPTSAASMAVELLQKKEGSLAGRRAVVIGNGKMGRLSAELLKKAGCDVCVTLRTYRHGETVVPAGCRVADYEDRFKQIGDADILISATTSPHYTVTVQQMAECSHRPLAMVDLAIPRDIQPETAQLDGITLYNIDDLGDFTGGRAVPQEVNDIFREHTQDFYRWFNYRDCLTAVDGLKQAVAERLLALTAQEDGDADEDLVRFCSDKTIDLLVSGLAEHITSEDLAYCEGKIRMRNTSHR